MSATAIIDSLKVGNAIETQLIKDWQKGMNAVAKGMLNECHNRNDALDEMRENIEAMVIETANTKRENLEQLIQDGLNACHDIKVASLATYTETTHEIEQTSEAFEKLCEKAQERMEERYDAVKATSEVLADLYMDSATMHIWRKLSPSHKASFELYTEDCASLEELRAGVQDMIAERNKKCYEQYKEKCERASCCEEVFGRIAKELGMESLEGSETSDEASDTE